MATSTILSDNGVLSGSAGIKPSGGNDGKLQLQTTTAGGTATAALTIDTSQNVGIGTASPAALGSDTVLAIYNASTPRIKLQNSTTGSTSTDGAELNMSSSDFIVENREAGNTRFYVNGGERMRIDSSGNVGIGTSSPNAKLDVSGGDMIVANGANAGDAGGGLYFKTSANSSYSAMAEIKGLLENAPGTEQQGGIGFYTRTLGTAGQSLLERARFTANGNFLVGTTNNNGQITVYTSATANNVAFLRATSTSFAGELCVVGCDRNTTNGSFSAYSYYNYAASQYRFKVLDSGNVQNSNNSYGAISDIKLKENITDATPKLEQLTQVRVVNYNFIGDTQKQLGVIAQELEQVFPGMVEETVDRDQEGNDLGTTTKAVKYSVFVPMLVKAIQELNAKVDAQAAEIAALKGQA